MSPGESFGAFLDGRCALYRRSWRYRNRLHAETAGVDARTRRIANGKVRHAAA